MYPKRLAGDTQASTENLLGPHPTVACDASKLILLEETHRAAEAALQADIKKLMKAVVAQRTHIETIEKEKLEQNQAMAALEKDLEESKSHKKELEKMKK